MITKNEFKYYSSLLQKKFRNEEKKFLVEGEKNVLEGLKSEYKAEVVFINNDFIETNPDLAEHVKTKARTELLKAAEFNKLSDTVTPQGIIAVFHKRYNALTTADLSDNLIVVLDNISDPGNTGTILRTCDWFGVKQVVLTTGSAEVYNSKTLRSSMGSVFHLKLYENIDLLKIIELLKPAGYKVYSTDLRGDNLYKVDFSGKSVLVFSNEAKGPSELVYRFADKIITIPGNGKAESLNVAASAAVVLAEVYRRKLI